MDTALFLKLQIYSFCLVVLIILWFSGDRRRESKTGADARLYRALLISTALMIVTDTLGLRFDGRPGTPARAMVWAANTLYFAFHSLPIPLAILYADFQIFRDERRIPALALPLGLVAILIAAFALLTPFLGLLFYVDGDNRFVRGPWYHVHTASQFSLSAYLVGHILLNRKRVNQKTFGVLATYPLPMVVAAVLQTIYPGLILVWPTMTLFTLSLATNIESRRSRTDFLTGAANRRSLDEELDRRVEASKSGRSLCGLLLDIDEFKAINDNFGHEAGDRALEDLSSILLASTRVDDCVARMGGDEFVVLADSREPLRVEELVRRVEAAIDNLNASGQRPYRLSASVGRALYDSNARLTGEEFLARLDADMYARKRDRERGRAATSAQALASSL